MIEIRASKSKNGEKSALGQGIAWNPRIGNPRILILLFELYRYQRQYWVRRLLETKKKEKRTRKIAVLRPKNERDCRFCCGDKGKRTVAKREMPGSWQSRKGRGGRK
jgi:hypothetical protein